MDLIHVYDCTAANLGSFPIPPDAVMAGYITGSGDVPWTPAQFSRYPNAIRIDQSPVNTPADVTADVYDLEFRAGTLTGLPEWVHGAWSSWTTGRRPGQRKPTVYCGYSSRTAVANALNAAGITMGVNLWVALETSVNVAMGMVLNGGGPFPIVGVQYQYTPNFDVSVFSATWINDQAKAPQKTQTPPNTQQGWGICGKCTSLFYMPLTNLSACAASGHHEATSSHNYVLGYLP